MAMIEIFKCWAGRESNGVFHLNNNKRMKNIMFIIMRLMMVGRSRLLSVSLRVCHVCFNSDFTPQYFAKKLASTISEKLKILFAGVNSNRAIQSNLILLYWISLCFKGNITTFNSSFKW